MLFEYGNKAWSEFSGMPLSIFPPKGHPWFTEMQRVTARFDHWITEGYRRIEALHKGASENPQGVESPLASQLNELRKECGNVSYEELADHLGIHPTNISRHMTGDSTPSRKTCEKYSDYFTKRLKTKIIVTKMQVKRS